VPATFRDATWNLLEKVRRLDASRIVSAFLERARAARARPTGAPLLRLSDPFRREIPLEDVFLLGLLTRAFDDAGKSYLHEWVHDLTLDVWRAKGASEQDLATGARALLRRIRSDRTSLARDGRRLGFPLGHVQLESDYSMALKSSAFLTVRTLSSELLVLEHEAYAHDRPPRGAILGVIDGADAGRDLMSLLSETGVEEEYLETAPRRATVVDNGVPAATFQPLLAERRRRGHL